MLDFYKIPDDTPIPEWPEQVPLSYLGGLELKEFEELKRRGLIGKKCDFWTNFRWDKKATLDIFIDVNKLVMEHNDRNERTPAVNKLLEIVQSAVEDKTGLLEGCD